jgi:hypothetical protein
MENKKNSCPICSIQFDNVNFFPTSFPGIEKEICCDCDKNISLMFTNFDKKPGGDDSYIVPDNSDRLEKVTGRSYLENRLIFFQYVLKKQQSEDKPANAIKELKDEIDKITLARKERNE